MFGSHACLKAKVFLNVRMPSLAMVLTCSLWQANIYIYLLTSGINSWIANHRHLNPVLTVLEYVCTACVVTLKVNIKLMSQQTYVLKSSKFNFQIVIWILFNSCHDKIAIFSYKVKQSSDKMVLINMNC